MSRRIEVSQDIGYIEVEIVVRIDDGARGIQPPQLRDATRRLLDDLNRQALDAVGRDPEQEPFE